jgi:cytochrome oxidase assembly protein ShyY1
VRFLLSRRWVLFGVAVGLLAVLAIRLGDWQFSRLEAREERNALIERNLEAEPADVDTVLAAGEPAPAAAEWRRVRASGEYAEEHTVVVRYRTRDGQSGVDVVTPLVTGAGTALLVDRGWLATANAGGASADVPPAPGGSVTVVGWVRVDATGDSAAVEEGSTRAISSREIARTLPFPVYGGFVELQSEEPPPAEPLVVAEVPDLSEGPHFFYGLQWWFFAALALFGFCYLAWDERRGRSRPAAAHRERSIPPSTGTMAPVRNEAAGESTKAAIRPNSSGRP